jgi:hypothetical protein
MYIPLSNIIETGYTQGSQYILPNGQSYKGFYCKDTAGRYWTGKEHTNDSIQLLAPFNSTSPINLNFISKNNVVSKPYTKIYNENIDTPLLKNDIIQPTSDDYDNGYFVRYVAQLKSSSKPEFNIVELNKESFNNALKNYNITGAYRLATFGWKLLGPLYDAYDNNIRIESGVVDSNLRSLQDVGKTIVNINLYFKDPLQFVIKPFASDFESQNF